MSIQSFFKSLFSTSMRRQPIRRKRATFRPQLEALEDRCLMTVWPLGGIVADPVSVAVPVPDFYSTPENTTVYGNVRDNDIGQYSSIDVTGTFTAPLHGIVELFGDGNFGYTPNVGFSGVDGFTYITFSGGSLVGVTGDDYTTSPAPVTITVGSAIDSPPTLPPVPPVLASTFAVAGFPSPTTAAAPGAFTITAQDSSGNTALAYLGTVHFTSSDAQAGLPADYTFTIADQGKHTFTATLKTSGTQSITAKDTVQTGLGGSDTGIAVNPAAASSLSVAGFPSPSTAGVSGSFTVTAKDPYGNTATGYTGTLHFTSSDAQAGLSANYTFTTADKGVHTFSVTLKTAGTQSITTTDTTNSGITGTDGGITVNPAAASHFTLTAPASATAGTSFSFTVSALDPYNNNATGYRGTVHLTSSDRLATLPANYTFTAADGGSHTFSATLRTGGTQTIKATDVSNSSTTGSATISVSSTKKSSTTTSSSSSTSTAPSSSGTTTSATPADAQPASANEIFVAQAYLDILQREVDPTELAYWSGQLDQGVATQSQIVTALVSTEEYQSLLLAEEAAGTAPVVGSTLGTELTQTQLLVDSFIAQLDRELGII